MSVQNQATSYTRVVRLKGDPTKVEEAIKLWTQDVLPVMKKQKGFTGVTLLGNRKTGDALTVSYWETEGTMKDARSQVRPEALKMLSKIGGSIVDDDECEVALLERFKAPMAGAYARVRTVQGNPAQPSAAIANFKENILPAISKQPGARNAYFFVNRQSGKTFGGSVWDTEHDLQKSEASIGTLRADAVKKFGGRDATTQAFENYFAEILRQGAA